MSLEFNPGHIRYPAQNYSVTGNSKGKLGGSQMLQFLKTNVNQKRLGGGGGGGYKLKALLYEPGCGCHLEQNSTHIGLVEIK